MLKQASFTLFPATPIFSRKLPSKANCLCRVFLEKHPQNIIFAILFLWLLIIYKYTKICRETNRTYPYNKHNFLIIIFSGICIRLLLRIFLRSEIWSLLSLPYSINHFYLRQLLSRTYIIYIFKYKSTLITCLKILQVILWVSNKY